MSRMYDFLSMASTSFTVTHALHLDEHGYSSSSAQ